MTHAMLLSELLPELEGLSRELAITGLVQDSRAIRTGDAFVAIGGFGTHGLAFTETARAAGAAAILFESPAPDDLPAPADAIPVVNLRARMGAMADAFHGQPSVAMTSCGPTPLEPVTPFITTRWNKAAPPATTTMVIGITTA